MKWWLRLGWAVLLLVLSGPLWVVGLVLLPPYYLERLCTTTCWKVLDYLRRVSARVEIVREDGAKPDIARARYFAKSRRNRRAIKVVRP